MSTTVKLSRTTCAIAEVGSGEPVPRVVGYADPQRTRFCDRRQSRDGRNLAELVSHRISLQRI